MTINWNPSDKSSLLTLAVGNYIATAGATSGNKLTRATAALSGLSYFEITVLVSASTNQGIGVQNLVNNTANSPAIAGFGDTNGLYYQSGGQIFYGNSSTSKGTSPGSWATGSIIGVAVDATNKRVWFTLNGTTWNAGGTANPATGVGYIDLSTTSGSLYPFVEPYDNGSAFWANFGQVTTTYSIPSGYSTPNALTSGSGLAAFRWNEQDTTPAATTDISSGLSTAGQTITTGLGGYNQTSRGNVGWTSGKVYFEVTMISSGAGGYDGSIVGVADLSAVRLNYPGSNTHSAGYQGAGHLYYNASFVTMPTFSTGDVIGVALDLTNKKVWFNKNGGIWNNATSASQDPASNLGGQSISTLSGAVFPAWGGFYNGSSASINGGPSMSFTAPSGFLTPALPASTGARVFIMG